MCSARVWAGRALQLSCNSAHVCYMRSAHSNNAHVCLWHTGHSRRMFNVSRAEWSFLHILVLSLLYSLTVPA